MPPPTTARDQYVIGKLGSYLAPTVPAVDAHLRKLLAALPHARPVVEVRLRQDIDELLDRRRVLQRE